FEEGEEEEVSLVSE
ncbi:hypothetical protein A2U01_0018124, partial [Trifolium medium]|nr:hypothetical protein [Trifolium medium]